MSTAPRKVIASTAIGFAPVAFLLIASFPALAPLLSAPYLQAHDAFAHLFRLFALDSAIKQGVLFSRWSPELVFGFGYPIFNFYNPAVSYVAELFHLAGLGFFDSLRAISGLVLLLSGPAMYAYLRSSFSRPAAIAGGFAYAFVPYHLLNAYVRGAVGEELCYLLFPLLLLFSDRAFPDGRPYSFGWAAGLGAGLALLILTHNPSALIFAALIMASILWRKIAEWLSGGWTRASALNTLAGLALVNALAVGLTAWFWLPFGAELGYTWIGRFPSGVEDFYRALTTPDQLVQSSILFSYDDVWNSFVKVGLVQGLFAVLGLAALRFLPPAARTRATFFAVAGVVLLLSMTVYASMFWRLVPIASLMTFPWRLQAEVAICTSVLTAAFVEPFRRWGWTLILPVAGVIGLTSLSTLTVSPLYVEDSAVNLATATRLDVDGALTGTTSPPQFVPRWAEYPVQNFTAPLESTPAPVDAAVLTSVEVVSYTPWRYSLRIDAQRAGPMRLRTFYFPGWEGFIDGRPAALRPEGAAGEIALDVPAGKHDVEIAFGTTPPRAAGEIVTLLTIVALAVGAAYRARRPGLAAGAAGIAVLCALLVTSAGGEASAFEATNVKIGNLTLAGWKVDESELRRRGTLRVDLLWMSGPEWTGEMDLKLKLLDNAGKVVADRTGVPVFGSAPTSRWQPSTLVRDTEELSIPADLPPGDYRLEASFVDGNGHEIRAEGDPQLKFTLFSPPGAVASTPAERLDTTLGNQLRLDGYSANGDRSGKVRRFNSGETIKLTLFWTPVGRVMQDYSTFVHVVDASLKGIAEQDSFAGNDLRFVSVWPLGRPVTDRYDLQIPPNVSPGRYRILTGLFSRKEDERLKVSSGPATDDDSRVVVEDIVVRSKGALPSLSKQIGQDWPGVAKLESADLPGSVSASGDADCRRLAAQCSHVVVLKLRATSAQDQPLVVFVHVLDSSGRLVAQHDSEPRLGNFPAQFWSVGDELLDPHPMPSLKDLPTGEYRVVAGMYRRSDGSRILAAGGETIELGTIRLGRADGMG